MPPRISIRQARRLALVAAGLYKPRWNHLPSRAKGSGSRARLAAATIVRHFGYLQLDTVSIAGLRSHSLVLLSRLRGLDPRVPEELLRPGCPFFEYWGHEASWLPVELYPFFEFRRQRFRTHPWWGDLLRSNRALARRIVERIESEGPLRSLDLEGERSEGMWNLKLSRKVADALWSCGDLAVRERRNFQIYYDLPSRVIPEEYVARPKPLNESLKALLLLALQGHGWAPTGTLTATWRLRNMRSDVAQALAELREQGCILECSLTTPRRTILGWIRPRDLDRCEDLGRTRPPEDRAVLLSPFDPLLWDRARVLQLFDFHQVLEIFKPAAERVYGYYCLPILVGERLVARCDLKAHRRQKDLEIRSLHFEMHATARDRELVDRALRDYAESLNMALRE